MSRQALFAQDRAALEPRAGAGAGAGWLVYLLRCGDGTLYCGITNDLAARLAAHRAGKGARYTRGRGPLRLVHQEPAADRPAALRREREIKAMPRAQKPQGRRRRAAAAAARP
jgi:putative endonuclease